MIPTRAVASIYEHILKSVKKDHPGLPPEGLAWPGIPAEALGSPFAAGAHDHLALYAKKKPAVDRTAEIDAIEKAVRALSDAREPSEAAIRALEEALDRPDPLPVVDPLMDRIAALELADWEPLYDALSAIALSTTRPSALKLAMALLGPFEEDETLPFFRTMARHPEFSLYAATALANDPSPAGRATLVGLLDETVGWAKVDVVERLLRVEDLDVGEVLLTKAMEDVEPVGGYIAHGLAERCDLAGALAAKGLTRDTLDGACRVLAQLATDAVEGGPAGTLDDYSDREAAIASFCERLPGGPADLEMALAAAALLAWAKKKPRKKKEEKRPLRGKRRPRILDVEEETKAYLERPDVVGAVISGLESRDADTRALAARLAARARMTDALSTVLEVVRRHPEDDAPVLAALTLAEGADLLALRDRLVKRIQPESRAGDASSAPALSAASRFTTQYLALIEALRPLSDPESRRILALAAKDRDPAIRNAAAGQQSKV